MGLENSPKKGQRKKTTGSRRRRQVYFSGPAASFFPPSSPGTYNLARPPKQGAENTDRRVPLQDADPNAQRLHTDKVNNGNQSVLPSETQAPHLTREEVRAAIERELRTLVSFVYDPNGHSADDREHYGESPFITATKKLESVLMKYPDVFCEVLTSRLEDTSIPLKEKQKLIELTNDLALTIAYADDGGLLQHLYDSRELHSVPTHSDNRFIVPPATERNLMRAYVEPIAKLRGVLDTFSEHDDATYLLAQRARLTSQLLSFVIFTQGGYDLLDPQKRTFELHQSQEDIEKKTDGFNVLMPLSKERFGIITREGVIYATDPKTYPLVRDLFAKAKDDSYSQYALLDQLKQEKLIAPLVPEEVFGSEQSSEDADRLRDLAHLLTDPMRDTVRNDFGLRLEELSIHEQGEFLQYLSKKRMFGIGRAMRHGKRYGLEGARAFLSLEHDADAGDDIIAFGERAAPDIATKVFTAYSAALDALDDTEGVLARQFGRTEADIRLVRAAARDMRRKAAEFLIGIVRTKELSEEVLLEKVREFSKAKLLFASIFRLLRVREGVRVADVPALELSKCTGGAVNVHDRWEILALFWRNHEHIPLAYARALEEKLKVALEDPSSFFYILRHQDDLIGMIRFDEKKDEKGKLTGLYAGSLNVDSSYGNGKLGEALFEASFEQEATRNIPIEGHVRPDIPIAARYLDWGFVADRVEFLEGILRWHLSMDKARNARLIGRTLSEARIIARAGKEEQEGLRVEVHSAPPREIPQGMLLTRVFSQGGLYYAVFEREPSSG